MSLTDLTLTDALAKLRSREISSQELTQAYLDRIQQIEPKIKSYITVTPERALEQAKQADERRANGEDAPLLGIPVAIKDILTTEGIQSTAGSRILEGFVPPYSATAVTCMFNSGAVMLGKANTDEFAMGSSTENSGYGTTHNPWDLDRIPGGTSGGSAAAVAAKLALGALGTDTGGSIRQPGAMCGVVGLKPSYGRVSRYGAIAFASSLDQIGPLARNVRDTASILQVIAGHDPLDSTSMNVPVPDYSKSLIPEVKGLKIGVPKEYFTEGMQPEVESAVHAAIDLLRSMGAQIQEISLPHTDYGIPVYYLVAPAEASANLARYDGVRYGPREAAKEMFDSYKATRGRRFGAEVKRRIMLGTYALSAGYYDAYYLKAQKVRTLIKGDFEKAFADVDVICCPVAPRTAWKIGEKVNDPLQMYLEDVFTVPTSLSGICGISVPCGFDKLNLPIGLQIIGPAFGEEKILHAAYAYEQATEWHKQLPTL
ncbi:MAG: Asp-tRNA(Asn)/Glu-tRNA(Gln) amidotransferase subunit GatA [Anaerolineae bacterium]|nr:Asp-tRNA(Asn)/Glu-tRNA(Gln) amidotransferase subunit GatA [Anaerolineae bacterium]